MQAFGVCMWNEEFFSLFFVFYLFSVFLKLAINWKHANRLCKINKLTKNHNWFIIARITSFGCAFLFMLFSIFYLNCIASHVPCTFWFIHIRENLMPKTAFQGTQFSCIVLQLGDFEYIAFKSIVFIFTESMQHNNEWMAQRVSF